MLLSLITVLVPSFSSSSDADIFFARASKIARMQAHYAAVECELRAADTRALDAERRAGREGLLEALVRYRERADFGLNPDYPGVRMPYFVDADGRRCAVAELLHVTGEDHLVREVAATANHAWIVDLHADPRFHAWLDQHGLTFAEAARIQFPAMDPPSDGGQGSGGSGGTSGTGPAAGGSWTGPGDTTPSGGGPARPSAPSGAGGTVTGGPTGSTPAPGPANPGTGAGLGSSIGGSTPSAPTLAMEIDDGWWLWWEYNKTEFLRPNGLAFWRITSTGDDAADAWRNRVIALRGELLPDLVGALGDGDAKVRAAAVDALAKLGSSAVVPHLLARLEDKSAEVRHHAILGLGACGAPEAVRPLLQIVRTGNVEGRRERISQIASAVAICALGLGRRTAVEAGFDELVDGVVVERLKEQNRSDHEAVACAAMIYQRLAPCAALELEALELAENRDESPSVRCRAIEALSTAKDKKTLSKLQHFLSSSRMDERRSAALALGVYADTLALPALQSAFEAENEPLTRGFLLVSIGRRGSEEARQFLTKTLGETGASMEAWCALALGLAAREHDSPSIRRALREGAAKERNRSTMGAWWLALGLARDLEARSILREALLSGADPRQKMYAATALALVGDADSAVLVRERMEAETNPFLDVAYSAALSLFARAQDAPAMVGVLAELKDPTLQGLAASALAFHGSREALDSLVGIAKSSEGSTVRRAAAIEGLSMMLGRTHPYTFGQISRQANYTVFSDWMKGMMQVSL